MNLSEYLFFCLSVVIMISTPGPVMLLVATAGLKAGYRRALQTIVGTNLASLLLIFLSVLMLKGILNISEQWFNIVKFLGCLYIFYLGFQIVREAWAKDSVTSIENKANGQGGFKQGFLVGISNPKDIIFFAAFFPQFVDITPNMDTSLLILTLSWIVLDFLTLSLVYLGFNKLSQLKIYHNILFFCGLILLAVAMYGIYSIWN